MNITNDVQLLTNTVDAALKTLATNFSDSPIPRSDALVLLSHIMNSSKAWLLAHKEDNLTFEQQRSLNLFALQVKKGIPLPYIIGHWEFYGLDFFVTPDVLIPRPETELLVEYAKNWLHDHPDRRHALDLGTGSGCIAITLATLFEDIEITALDISPAALAVAKENAIKHQVDFRINFILSDLLNPIYRPYSSHLPPFDIIIANLPYIPSSVLEDLAVFKKEPSVALDGGPDGLVLINRLLQTTCSNLAQHGCILLEIDAEQGSSGSNLAKKYFPEAEIRIYPDLTGRDRLLIIQT